MRSRSILLPLAGLLLLTVVGCPDDSPTEPGAPGSPTIGAATPGNASASIAFTPASGGAVVAEFVATCTATPGSVEGTATSSPVVVTGLTNGTQYSCRVIAVGTDGEESEPSGSVLVTPYTTPDAPTLNAVTRGNASALASFAAPSFTGGNPITSYTVSCLATGASGAVTATGPSSPITVTSLANGTQYSCTVRATNAAGSSAPSNAIAVTPATTPGAPAIGTATAGNGSATVSFTAPASNGGSAITSFTVQCAPSGAAASSATGANSPITVTGLTNGTTYSCTVTANNAVGAGVASSAASVTPSAGAGGGATPPGAPTIGAATAGNGQASIAFTAPASNGGSAITGYTVTCTAVGQTTRTGSGASSPITVLGMTNGVAYSCSVTASNAAGISPSSSSVSVTPTAGASATVPGAPTIGAATAGNTQASVAFTAPANNGGASITGYTVTCTAAGQTTRTGTGGASPITVTSMTNGVTYACSVTATNSVGTSAASSSVSVTPTSGSTGNTGTRTLCGYSWNQVNSSVTNAGSTVYTSIVSYTCTASTRSMTMNQIPDHPAAAQTQGNPNKMSAQTNPVKVDFTLDPALTGSTTPKGNVVGWAINGVKFDPATAEICPTQSYCNPSGATYGSGTTWNVEALGQTLFSAGVDGANAHIQPGGAYHYHGMPNAYLTYLNKGTRPTLIGFAVDGFPVYAKYGYSNATDTTSAVITMTPSYRLKLTIPTGRPDTSVIKYGTFTQDWEYSAELGHLDECNGRTGKTPEFPDGVYHYYITDGYPYIQRCLKGSVPASGVFGALLQPTLSAGRR